MSEIPIVGDSTVDVIGGLPDESPEADAFPSRVG